MLPNWLDKSYHIPVSLILAMALMFATLLLLCPIAVLEFDSNKIRHRRRHMVTIVFMLILMSTLWFWWYALKQLQIHQHKINEMPIILRCYQLYLSPYDTCTNY